MLETEENVCDGFQGEQEREMGPAAERRTEDKSWDQREAAGWCVLSSSCAPPRGAGVEKGWHLARLGVGQVGDTLCVQSR